MPHPEAKTPSIRTLSALIAGGVAVCLAACGDSAGAKKATADAARPVLTQTVHFAKADQPRTFVGVIKPRVEADLGFRVTGKVFQRLVDVGARVKAGDLLAVLDETDFKLQLEQAEAEVAAATGAIATAQAEFDRRTFLNSRGYATAANLDIQKTAVDEAKGRLTKGERALLLARNALGYARLTADADGVVTAVLAETGQVLPAGQAAFRVARTGEREALVAIPEAAVEQVRNGVATVTLWTAPAHAYAARLRELAPAADSATRTYSARFSIPDAGPELVLGMTATVAVDTRIDGRLARVPLSALFNQGDGPALWVVDPASGTLTLKPVKVASYDANSALIADGVADGEQIVALGVQKLDAHQKVRVVTALGS